MSDTPPFRERLIAFLAAQPDITFPVEVYDSLDLQRFVGGMLKWDDKKTPHE